MLKRLFTGRIWLFVIIALVVLAAIVGLLLRPRPQPDVTATIEPTEIVTPEASATVELLAAPGEYDFEDGTTQGWVPRGEASVSVATDVVHSGSYSLLTTDRKEGWNGATVDVSGLLEPGNTYEIGGYVRLAEGEPDSRVVITMQRTPVGGDALYEWIAPSPENGVTDAEWVYLQGRYSFSGAVSELLLYVESPDEELVDFYIDDITITLIPSTEGPRVYDFEDGTTQGWVPRGEASVNVATGVVHSGSYSLLTTDRKADWHGAIVNMLGLLEPGSTYEIGGYVRLAGGEPASRVIITMQRTPVGGGTKYEWIAPSAENGVTDAEWVYLQGQYSFSGEVSELLLYVESPDAELVGFYIDDIVITRLSGPSVQTDIPSVHETLSPYFLVGAALEPDQLDSERHATLLTHHFNSLTAENVMKPGSIQPTEGNFRWTGPDKLVQFARDNDMAVHGHTLVWHQQAAEWMFRDSEGNPLASTPENKALVLQRLETHIRAVVGRYKDDVNVWDVVNEVIDPSQPDCMLRSRWYELTGTDYIVTAFQVVHEVAPDAVLLINDYGTTDPQRRTCLYNVVRDLRAQGVPIDGVGHQMHINIENPSAAEIEETILMFAELDVEQHITELDVSIYTNDTDSYTTVPEEILVRQGHRYKEVFDVFKRQAAHIQSVTFWGMADDHTWLKTFPIARVNLPLLFDEQLQAKPAYWGIVDPTQLPVAVQQMTVAAGTPTIDGDPEIIWTMQPWAKLQATETFTASFQTLWDEDYLYLFVDVEDSTPGSGDKVEVFIDENNAKAGAYEDDDVHYTCQDGACTPSAGVIVSMQTTSSGYRFEAAFPLATAATTGGQIGFDLCITDGSRPDTPYSWSDPTHSQDTSTVNFGTLKLAEAVRLTVAVRGTPVIDGIEDAVWADAVEVNTTVWVLGESGATARVKTLWDDEHLYVLAVVSDSLLSKAATNPWEQDSFEVFLDQNNAKTTRYESDDGQYRVNYDNEQSFNGAAAAELITSATRIVPGGYVVELAITLDAVTPQEGMRIGFDFQVNNDEDGDGVRDSVVTWNDPTHQSYQNTSRLGVLQFVKQAE